MNAITPLSHSVSPIALGAVIAFPRPRHEPEIEAANAAAAVPPEPDATDPEDIAEPEAPTADMEELVEPEPEPEIHVGPTTALADRAALTRAVEIVAHVIERRNTIPILSNVKIVGDGSNLRIVGTDLDIEIAVTMPAAADEAFALTVPAHMLKDLLKKATASDFVGFTAPRTAKNSKGGHECDGPAVLDFERVNYRLQALPVADFPTLAAGEFSHSFSLPGETLIDAFARVHLAISTEETRYYLNGIYMHAHDTRRFEYNHATGGMDVESGDVTLRFVATDGHRLMRQDVAAPEGCIGMPGIIIPRKTVAELMHLMKGKKCPETVQVDLSETRIRFTFDDVTVTSKLVDGTFPDYQRVIPQHNRNLAKMAAADLAEAVRAVSLISSERGRAVRFEFSEGKCRLTVNNPDAGSATADIACDYDGRLLEIGFNAKYVTDNLATADSETITWAMEDPGSPCVITGDREGWLAVQMPMRV